MNTFYARVGRLLDGKTSFFREGYYILCEDQTVRYQPEKPERIEVVTSGGFLDALVGAGRHVIESFAGHRDNRQVYAFCLNASVEYKHLRIYMNTEERFRQNLREYVQRWPKYDEPEKQLELKYSLGDFAFEFWQEHMGEHGSIIEAFEDLAYAEQDIADPEPIRADDTPLIAFEAGIVKEGFAVLAMKAVERLLAEDAFAALHRSDEFVAFVSTDDDCLDYSLTMRKTIPPELFNRLFPSISQSGARFEAEMAGIRHLSVSEAIEYWMPAIHDHNRVVSPYTYVKSDYDIFIELERYGRLLAAECLRRMDALAAVEKPERHHYEELYAYIEAMHYGGALTQEQRDACAAIAGGIRDRYEEIDEAVRDLLRLAGRNP